MSQERQTLDGVAISVILLLTALWAFQQVTVKWIAAEVSLVMQAAVRSILATVLLLAWARLRGLALFERDGTLWPGIVTGLLFVVLASDALLRCAPQRAELISVIFVFAALLVAAGIVLVNLRAKPA